MPFESRGAAAKRIAVIGGGISGMGAAYHLAETSRVVLFEAANRLGGHARTVLAGKHGDQPVDTGFIVFNHQNYPNLVALFEALDVPIAKSDMSFGVSVRGGSLEYGLASLDAIFTQRKNAFDPRYLRMIRDIMRFNAKADEVATPGMTIGDLIAVLGLGAWFRDYYLTPFSGAIWSTPTAHILDFPARALIKFFKNHNLLGYEEKHQWYTVKGGSIQYVSRLQNALESRGVDVRLRAATRAVHNSEPRCAPKAANGNSLTR